MPCLHDPCTPAASEHASSASSAESDVYAITTSKGTDGGTTAINLGATLAHDGHRVVIVNAGSESMDVMLTDDLPVVGSTLADVLAGDVPIEAAVRTHHDAVDVIPLGDPARPGVDWSHLATVLGRLETRYDIVLVQIDTDAQHGRLPAAAIGGMVVATFPGTSPRPRITKPSRAIESSESILRVEYFGRGTEEMTDTGASDRPVTAADAVIPNDEDVWESIISGRPLPRGEPESPAAAAYRELAASLLQNSA